MLMSPGVIASTGGGLFHLYWKTPCWAKAAPPASVKAALANARPHKARQNAKRGKAKRAGTTILPPHLHRCLRSGPPRDCIKSVRTITARVVGAAVRWFRPPPPWRRGWGRASAPSVLLERAQLQGQHALSDARHQPAQLVEAPRLVLELEQDGGL